jgi:hypothetical protein
MRGQESELEEDIEATPLKLSIIRTPPRCGISFLMLISFN